MFPIILKVLNRDYNNPLDPHRVTSVVGVVPPVMRPEFQQVLQNFCSIRARSNQYFERRVNTAQHAGQR